ncbi:Septum formation protein Maf [Slackia heliotrinireducens]|uniref:dTTP/UTP pyrophosphatase n=1 Tax=Slackia heliotrinireducens (strain ATCC 29202 / DSM 20476 / NCTC 11029 / RHS 1) TaxID=471855 RepID=C7N380_SLAHD|nr:Maf family protein [Slackia heliotrinireducens]ACV21601.1 MAF protein [Slackia heliotrinireducens DSM 20476]VEG99142.1 Septum formation protein Maf [Slackia heliotrinireducens]
MAQSFDIFLASGSPRRRELLTREGVDFSVRTAEVDEYLTIDERRDPEQAAKSLAERKARASVEALLNQDGYTGMAAVIAADTMVVLDGEIYGKPVDEDDAMRMLGELSGRTHQVITGVSVWLMHAPADNPEELSLGFRSFAETSHVRFKDLDEGIIAWYVGTGEPMDKAGAYGIQGLGGDLVADVRGDFDNVVGLPVKRLVADFADVFGLEE